MKSILFSLVLLGSALSTFAQQGKEILYVGTFSVRGSEGIYVYEFERSKGTFTRIQIVQTFESPSFLAVHPSGKFLYSVNRGATEDLANSGSVSAYAIDAKSGKLSLLNHKPSYGRDPCHISIDQTGRLAFISNYTEGNFIVLEINKNGSLDRLADSVRFHGSSVNASRQGKPYIHSA